MARCCGCGRAITGTYRRALDRDWHPQCFTCCACKAPITEAFAYDGKNVFHGTCFVCSLCKQPIGPQGYINEKGGPYHGDCHRKKFGKVCAACNNMIDNQGIQALGAFYHPQCFTCQGCGLPFGGKKFVENNGKPYHEPCYHKAFTPPCDICGAPLIKNAVMDSYKNAFCKKHSKQLPSCFSCGRLICEPLTQGGKKYDDGRTICNICFPTAVNEQEQARNLLEKVRGSLVQMGFSLGDRQLDFRLVDLDELKRLSNKKSDMRKVQGLTRTKKALDQKGQVTHRKLDEIVILYGLPETWFNTVAAHELCHAWLFFNRFDKLPLKVEEGLCTLVEYLYMKTENPPDAALRIELLMTNPDPIYGDGFRAALKALKKKKLPELLAYVKEKRRFPGFSLIPGLF